VPSTTDVIQVATGVASLAVSALALREARLQRVGRGEPGPPPPSPAPRLPADEAALMSTEPVPPPLAVPPPVAPPARVLPPEPATATAPPEPSARGVPARPDEDERAEAPPWGGPPEAPGAPPPHPPARPPWGAPAESPGGAPPAPPAWGYPGDPTSPPGWSPRTVPEPPPTRSQGWRAWAAVVAAAAVLLGLGYAVLALGQTTGATARPGEARQGWLLGAVALLALTVVTALVVRRGRAPSRVAWVVVPAVLAAASVAVIVFALPVPAWVKLGAVVAALGVAAWVAFRR
jgi:hypothetical protein